MLLKRLERFREEACVPVPMLPVPWDVVDLPSRIDELVRERDALRAGAAPSSFGEPGPAAPAGCRLARVVGSM